MMLRFNQFKKFLVRLTFFFPSPLPIGMTEFEDWADSILAHSVAPNNDSTRFALATMILHLPSLASWKSKEYFLRALHKSAANQIAAGVMQDLKQKQADAAKAAAQNPNGAA